MVECRYCECEFDDESVYHGHLQETHTNELGPIDRRRLEANESKRSRTPLVLAGVVLVLALGVMAGAGYVLLNGGGSGADASVGNGGGPPAAPGNVEAVAQDPSGVGSVHYHGTIEMRVAGRSVDFSQSEYQLQADAFHFENGEGTRWHGHAQGITLEYAMSTLGIGVTNESVTFGGETYREGANVSVTVTVNGKPVVPSKYVLREGDSVRIIVQDG